MKKLLIVFVFFLFILVALYAWKAHQPQPADLIQKNGAGITALPPSLPPTESTEKYLYFVPPTEVAFPKEIPVFEFSSESSQLALAQSISKSLGFSEKPSTIVGGRGAFYSWVRGEESLSVGGNIPEISYTTRAAPSPIESIAGFEDKINGFYQRAGLLSPVLQKNRVGISYFSPKDGTLNKVPSAAGATLVEFSYQYTIDQYPVFFRNPSVPSASFRFNGKGEPVSFSLAWLPELKKKDGVVLVVPVKDAVATLKSGGGSVVQVFSDSDQNEESFRSYDVSSFNITQTVLGFYAGKGSTTLWPVYVFSGQGKDAKSANAVRTTVVVSALAP